MLRISLFLLLGAVSVEAAAGELTDARWISPGADHVAALTQAPGECLATPANGETAYSVEVGRVAFKSPLLLGGQAARGGLSCASCHVDGRANPAFFIEGLSGAPGTADVTSSIFSDMREDGDFNPAPIPTLVDAGRKASFGSAAAPSLHAFINAALIEEFQAERPPEAVLNGLIAYVNALDPSACPDAPVAQTSRRAMSDVDRALVAAMQAFENGDTETADFMLASAQAMLGRINERFPSDKGAPLRADLAVLSRDIAMARKAPDEAAARLPDIRRDARRLDKRLHKARRFSLYDPRALADFLGRQEEN
ncbi:MAG: hypothetical protein AB7F91_12860 [Parvularculaceae bacterium]